MNKRVVMYGSSNSRDHFLTNSRILLTLLTIERASSDESEVGVKNEKKSSDLTTLWGSRQTNYFSKQNTITSNALNAVF